MGTGASVALSSSDFCLLSSNLLSLLTVLDLAKATFNKSESPPPSARSGGTDDGAQSLRTSSGLAASTPS